MRISQQIGWSQESKLIYQLVQQTERINQLLPGNQGPVRTNVSKQIGWSNEANLYYEWLRSLNKLTTHFACPDCITTTTTSTTALPPLPNLSLTISNSPNFDSPEYTGGDTGNFTIEWWAKMTDDSPHPRAWSIGSWPTAAHAVSIENGQFYYWVDGTIISATDISGYSYIGQWTHFCVMRGAGTVYIYLNGEKFAGGFGFNSAIPTNGYPLYLGSEGNDSLMNTLMSNFRWNNTPVYDPGGFIPPTAPLTNIPGTQLLIFQGDSLPLELTDNSGMGYTITNGSGVYNADNPFAGYQGSIAFGTV